MLCVEVGLFLFRKFLQEQQRGFHVRAGGLERVGSEADDRVQPSTVFNELAHANIEVVGVVEDAFGKHDAEPSAWFEQINAALDEKQFGLDLVSGRQLEE